MNTTLTNKQIQKKIDEKTNEMELLEWCLLRLRSTGVSDENVDKVMDFKYRSLNLKDEIKTLNQQLYATA